jgi:hypothetical protein
MKNFKELILKIQAANKKLEHADKRKKKLRILKDPDALYTLPGWGMLFMGGGW